MRISDPVMSARTGHAETVELGRDGTVAVSLDPPAKDLLHPWSSLRVDLEPLQLDAPASLLGVGVRLTRSYQSIPEWRSPTLEATGAGLLLLGGPDPRLQAAALSFRQAAKEVEHDVMSFTIRIHWAAHLGAPQGGVCELREDQLHLHRRAEGPLGLSDDYPIPRALR
jgi:hypothetical protein